MNRRQTERGLDAAAGDSSSYIPAEAAPGVGQAIVVDLNGVTDRRNVPGGIRVRHPAPADGAEVTKYSIELTVHRCDRGARRFLPVPRELQVADRPTWLDALERGFVPAGVHGLRQAMDMRGELILGIAAPAAQPLIWTGADNQPEWRSRNS